jgi:hypothetical protein
MQLQILRNFPSQPVPDTFRRSVKVIAGAQPPLSNKLRVTTAPTGAISGVYLTLPIRNQPNESV